MNMIELLSKTDIFEGLDQSQLNAVKDCCQIKKFNEGERVCKEEEEATVLRSVIEGKLDLRFDLPGRDSSKEMTIATISERKSIGWSSFVPPYKYRLSVYCSSKGCQVIEIDKTGLIKVFETNSLIGYRVMANVAKIIGTRFQQLQDDVALIEGEKLLYKKDN